jgi:hypothetical protein
MGIQLRQANSGEFLLGTASGQVPTWNHTRRVWEVSSLPIVSRTSPVYVEDYLADAGGDLRVAMIAAQADNTTAGTNFVMPVGTYSWVVGTTFQPRNNTTWWCYGCTIQYDVAGAATGQCFIFLRSDTGVGTHADSINIFGLRADILNVVTSFFSAAIQFEWASNCSIVDCDFRCTFNAAATQGRIRWGANLLGGDQTSDPSSGRRNIFQNIRLVFSQLQGCGAGRDCDGIIFDNIESIDSNDLAVSCVSSGSTHSVQNVIIRSVTSQNVGGSGVVLAGSDGAGTGIGAGVVRNLLVDGVWLDGQRSTPDLSFAFSGSVTVCGGLVTENVVVQSVGSKLAPNASLQAKSVNVLSQTDETSWDGLGLSNLELGVVTTNDPLEALFIAGTNMSGVQITNVNVRGVRGVWIQDADELTLTNLTVENGSLTLVASTRDLTKGIQISNANLTRTTGFQITLLIFSGSNRSFSKVQLSNIILNGNGNPLGVSIGAGTAQLWLCNIENTSGNNPDAATLASIIRTKNVRGFIVPVTVSVTVPAVAAGAVGYVNVSLASTRLSDVAVGENIVAQPTADLVAAGAGGAYANARVSSTGTVRLAFIGPLAGGASNFNFDRVD